MRNALERHNENQNESLNGIELDLTGRFEKILRETCLDIFAAY
jgi:hypothetical protein